MNPNKSFKQTHKIEMVTGGQLIALRSLCEVLDLDYNDLAFRAISSAPRLDDLTHDEALKIIKHGNVLYNQNSREYIQRRLDL